MRSQGIGTLLTIALAAAVAAWACEPQAAVQTGPEEVNYWEQRKGNCDQVLTTPSAFDIKDVTRCMKLWETYRSVGDLSVDLRSMYGVAFSLVWYKAEDEYEQLIADAALRRLCIKRHPLGNDGKVAEQVPDALECGGVDVASNMGQGAGAQGGGTDAGSGGGGAAAQSEADALAALRGSVNVRDISEKRLKKARGFNKKGLRAYNKKRFGEAIDYYEQALDLYPHYVIAKYNHICSLALLGDSEGAIEGMEQLYSWDDPQVGGQLIKARTDEDLFVLRDNMRFKQLTGYFRLVLANGAGEFGLPHVERLVNELSARRFPIASTVNDKNPRMKPVIFYRPGFESYAKDFKLLLNAKKVDLAPIDWETLDDMIIIWGQPEAANLFADDVQAAPIVQGTRAEEKKDGLGEITGAIDDATGGAEDLKGAGEGVSDAVPE